MIKTADQRYSDWIRDGRTTTLGRDQLYEQFMRAEIRELRAALQSQAQQPEKLDHSLIVKLAREAGVNTEHGIMVVMSKFAELVRSQTQQAPFQLPENEIVMGILGRPNFGCIGIANALRKKGHIIKNKSEDEQATVLRWLLNLYLLHGDNWATVGDEYLNPKTTLEN